MPPRRVALAAKRNAALRWSLATLLAGCGATSFEVGPAPRELAYSANPATYTRGVAIALNTPSSGGGAAVSFSVRPPLPPGLVLGTSTGVISGTPTVVAPQATYRVTAANAGGSTTADVFITVNDVPPADLAYASSPATYTKGVAIEVSLPSSAGGPVTRYSVSPSLPPGLELEPSTGGISGTPTAVTPRGTYEVVATNSGGSVSFALSIAVNDVPPADLTYPGNPAEFTRGTALSEQTPSSAGGAVESYSVTPALPAGLRLDPVTGVLSGVPATTAPRATYTVTATNSGGSASCALSIAVKDAPPANLTYPTNPAVYARGVAIVPQTPTSTGGSVESYSVAPPLPAGLILDPASGVLSGVPETNVAEATYTVTAASTLGEATVHLLITVRDAFPPGPVCSTGGWCWAHPLPQGHWLKAVWGTGANDVWAAGMHGTVLHWDGASWSGVPSGTTAHLRGVWGSGLHDVWAVGDGGTILRWNGAVWSQVASGTTHALTGIWGTGSDVWAVGLSGTVLRWNGSDWSAYVSGTSRDLRHVWGSGSEDVWAVGASGTLLHWDGAAWSPAVSGTTRLLHGIWGSGPDDVWAAGELGTLLHWDGTTWSGAATGTMESLAAVWGSGPGEAWAVGAEGTTLRWDGDAWSASPSTTSNDLYAGWASGAGEAWAVGAFGAIERWGSSAGSGDAATRNFLGTVWGTGPSDVWVGGIAVLMRWDGGAWSKSPGISDAIYALWGGASTDVWAAGSAGALLHWDGAEWTSVASGTAEALYGLWGTAGGDAWAVGGRGTILQWTGTGWSALASGTTANLFGVWGSGDHDVWAVGAGGTILHWNGSSWLAEVSGTTEALYAVQGSGADDLWAVGDKGTILHRDASGWSARPSGTTAALLDVWANGAGDAWAVGPDGAILHWNGEGWSATLSGVADTLQGVWGTDRVVWTVGADGTVLKHDL